MKQLFITFLLCLFIQVSFAQKLNVFTDSIPAYFNEIKQTTQQHYSLWDKDLYGGILLVNPQTREIYANEPDSSRFLVKEGSIYKGILPNEINFANTAIEWNGQTWAMIILPLPKDKYQRTNLLAHELFHKAQPSLGFVIRNVDNNHLDQKDGRIYLRLEMEALKEAVLASTQKEAKENLTNALIIRKYRNKLFPGSDTTENTLELLEGIADYTGQMMSGCTKDQMKENLVKHIDMFMGYPTFVRSFAYQTVPVYGFLLSETERDWNKKISQITDLTAYFTKAFGVSIPKDLKGSVERIADRYNAKVVIAEETAREEKNKILIAEYKSKFIEQPHIDIQLEQMRFAFDPRNIMPLEDKGTVYPNIRITDKWGVLTVTGGALVSSNWKKVSITKPAEINEQKVTGDGWVLELEAGYKLVEVDKGNYQLQKK